MSTINSTTLTSDNQKKTPADKGPVVVIQTEAPIPVAHVRRKFKENVEFHLDYSAGKYKGRPLINYLSSVDINVRLMLTDQEDALELVKAYLEHPGMAKINDLIDIVMNLMLALTGKPNSLSFDPTLFAMKNNDILNTWFRRVGSLPLFAFHVDPAVSAEYVDSFPVDTDDSLPGINFVHLISHPLFPILIDGMPESAWNKNPTFFNEHVFAGKNLFYYFATPDNPLHIAAISAGKELPEAIKAELTQSLEE